MSHKLIRNNYCYICTDINICFLNIFSSTFYQPCAHCTVCLLQLPLCLQVFSGMKTGFHHAMKLPLRRCTQNALEKFLQRHCLFPPPPLSLSSIALSLRLSDVCLSIYNYLALPLSLCSTVTFTISPHSRALLSPPLTLAVCAVTSKALTHCPFHSTSSEVWLSFTLN